MKCHNCGEEINDDAKFCKYCGAQTIQNTEEKSNKFGNLKIIGIIIIAIIAIFLVLGFLSGSEVSGPGFSLDLPSGYYSEESTYFASGGHVTPYYEVFDENGTNCISISYITKVENSKEIRKDIKGYMSDSGFEKIKKIKIGDAKGYKGVYDNGEEKQNVAIVTLKGTDYCYYIEYDNKGNLSYIKDNINLFESDIPVTVTEPDKDIVYNGNGKELKTKYFTLNAPEGWSIENETDDLEGLKITTYDIISDKNSSRAAVIVTNLKDLGFSKDEVKSFYKETMKNENFTNIEKYNLGGAKGKSFYDKTKYDTSWGIINYKGKNVYSIVYSDEESLGVINTIQFK